MSRIAPSEAFANADLGDLGQGDRINLGVAAIMTRRPAVAQALGGLTAALRSSGTLSPRLLELGVNCAVAVGIGRLTATWDVIEDVPDAFHTDSDTPVVPWVSGAVVATG
jgi:hypothetical protein